MAKRTRASARRATLRASRPPTQSRCAASRPPTPNPSPPLASLAGGGEKRAKRIRRLRLTRRPPSPMIFTDELLADARRRYEQTAEAKGAISADLGIARSTFDHLVTRLGWRRFTPPARDFDAAAKLAAKAQAFSKAVATDKTAAATAREEAEPVAAPLPPAIASAGALDGPDDVPMDTPALIDWLRREIQAQVVMVKRLREQERVEPLTDEAAIRLSRILASLTEATTKLDRHTGGPSRVAAEPDDLPENIDDIRIDLARRIDAFIASRADAGDAQDAAAASADRA